VSIAVSGGADSMALLLLAYAHGLGFTVHHVDHQLREHSHRDVEVITPVAERLGLELVVHVVSVEPGPNLEARARDARYDALPIDAMTGHTADDQAETVLINLLRGAGTSRFVGDAPWSSTATACATSNRHATAVLGTRHRACG